MFQNFLKCVSDDSEFVFVGIVSTYVFWKCFIRGKKRFPKWEFCIYLRQECVTLWEARFETSKASFSFAKTFLSQDKANPLSCNKNVVLYFLKWRQISLMQPYSHFRNVKSNNYPHSRNLPAQNYNEDILWENCREFLMQEELNTAPEHLSCDSIDTRISPSFFMLIILQSLADSLHVISRSNMSAWPPENAE